MCFSFLSSCLIKINYFDKYPLITQKQVDFLLFKQVVELIVNKEHLTKEGLIKIINIKAAMNLGVLPETLKAEFKVNPDLLGDRELMKSETPRIPDIHWIRGFIEEGCFYINIYKRKDTSLGLGVKLVFKVTQDFRNQGVLELLC